MIEYPSPLDNYAKAQLSLEGMGHYMDDYYFIIPPDKDPHEILNKILQQTEKLNLTVNEEKTVIVPLTEKFR